jgi:sorbitol-specific phosphotransferase system component IIBC
MNAQLKIVRLVAKKAIHAIEKPNGYDMIPWRLALHNNHTDPIKNQNQKDVARFLLAKQFSGKIDICDSYSMSLIMFYNLKKWVFHLSLLNHLLNV